MVSPPFLFLKYRNKNVAATNVIANPASSEEINVNGFVPSVKTDVNCKIGIYSKVRTTNLRISEIILILPLNQLLSKVPDNIVAIPIHSSVIIPWAKLPTIILLEIISEVLIPDLSTSVGILEKPLATETNMIRIPAKIENIRIKVLGVGLPSDPKALSISNARIMNALPSMLRRMAIASFVNPNRVASPLATNRAPGTPKKNFEYRGSKTSILI